MKKKMIYFILGFILLLIAAGYLIYQTTLNPYRQVVKNPDMTLELDATLTKAQAIEDLSYVLDHIRSRHPACMDGLPDSMLKQSKLEQSSFSDQVSVLELWQAISRTMAVLKDGHTNAAPLYDDILRLPLQFYMEDGFLFCQGGPHDGSRIVSIGGIRTEELYQRYLEQSSYELEAFASYLFRNHIRRQEYLRFLGVDVSSQIDIVFETTDGSVTESYLTEPEPAAHQTQEVPDFVTYEIHKEQNVGVLTLTQCIYDDVYKDTLRQFFTEVKEHNIRHVAVDLRNNGGGNSLVIDAFVRYLDIETCYIYGDLDVRYGPYLRTNKKAATPISPVAGLTFDGSLYILTSGGTFSSATDFATAISDNGLGYIVGEVSGGMPSSYGDLLTFQTPHAKLMFAVSYKYFHRPDSAKDAEPLWPDYPVSADHALDRVYELAAEEDNLS